jgi:hypothetical protein
MASIALNADFDVDTGDLSDAAFRTHVEALRWTAEMRTGGVITPGTLRRLAGTGNPVAAAELTQCGLWTTRPDAKGWHITRNLNARHSRTSGHRVQPAEWIPSADGVAPWNRPDDYPAASARYWPHGPGDELLYIGVADFPAERFRLHRHSKEWWHLVRYVDIEWFSTRAIAECEETRAVRAERPRFNIRGTGPAPPRNIPPTPAPALTPRMRVYRNTSGNGTCNAVTAPCGNGGRNEAGNRAPAAPGGGT